MTALRVPDVVSEEGRWVYLRPIDYHRNDGHGTPLDLADLTRLYARPENERQFCSGVTMNPERMAMLVNDVWGRTQRVVSPVGGNEVLGHLVASHADFQNGHCKLSVILATEHAFAVEAIPLFLDLIFSQPFRRVYIEAPEYNAAQFTGHLVRQVLGEPTIDPGYYLYQGKEWDQFRWALSREVWENSGFSHGDYLNYIRREKE